MGESSVPIRLSSVLLPLPEGPTIATSLPGLISKETPCSTSTGEPPKVNDLPTPRSSSIGDRLVNRDR